MNEIQRINTLAPLTYTPDRTVSPAQPVADKRVETAHQERRKVTDRRKRKQNPLIERRVSSDRRSPLLDEKA